MMNETYRCMCVNGKAPHTDACLRSNGINVLEYSKDDTLLKPKKVEPTALELAFQRARARTPA